MNWRARIPQIVAALALLIIGARLMPQALAFPYCTETAGLTVRSEYPLDPAQLAAVAAEAQRRVALSPLASPPERRDVFLTRGGWRWHLLALQSSGAFAVSLGWSEDIVVNRSSIAANSVSNGRKVGGQRTLAAIIAHEMTHGMIRHRFGPLSSLTQPNWLIEGYCDHVAQESSLTLDQARAMQRAGSDHPAVPYALGRERVAQELAKNGGDVDALFAGTH